MKPIDYILTRRSIRNFTSQKVSDEHLQLLVKAGMSAPSAVNKQPWDFIIITESRILEHLSEHLPYAKMLEFSPAAIVVCGNMHKALNGWENQFWIQDCSAAAENILLAAHTLGLGSVWTAVYPESERMRHVSEALNLPDDIIPLCILPIGYPGKYPSQKDRWDPNCLHWEKW